MKLKFIETLKDEQGQIVPWMVFLSVLFLGVTGLTVDLGHAYICYRELQASTDAAALAGAYAMTISGATQTTVKAEVNAFSSISGTGANGNLNLPSAAVSTSFKCITDSPLVTVGCTAFNTSTTATPNGDNVIVVAQTAVVPTYFIRMLKLFSQGPPASLTLSTIATAGIQSGPPEQVNVALVVDTTASMGSNDTDPLCGSTRINCALAGVQTMLQGLTPCAAGYTSSSCTAYDTVSLFTFPAIRANTVSNDTNCSGNNPTIVPYSTPAQGSTWSAPTGTATTYQVTGYLSNYSSTNGQGGALASTSSSTIVAATSNTGNCGKDTPGGAGTYYAGAIYAAQSSLAAQSAANTNTKNVMVILSDGDASSGSGGCSLTGGVCIMNTATGKAATAQGATYPSTVDQCTQAANAAKYASLQGTTVYTIAYGASSSGCSTDTGSFAITPCQAMQQMSSGWPSDTSHFYSDSTASANKGQCTSTNSGSLSSIFSNLAAQFSHARLLPNNIS